MLNRQTDTIIERILVIARLSVSALIKISHRSNLMRVWMRLLRSFNYFASAKPMSRNDVRGDASGGNSYLFSPFPFSFSLNGFKSRVGLLSHQQGFSHHSAMTLAEVLITLGIIGVIAAMTLPSLIDNINNAELKTAWKKTFSTFSTVTNTLVSDNGGTLVGLCTDDIQGNCLRDKFAQYVKYIKSCDGDMYSVYGKCWHLLDGNASKWLNGDGIVANGFIWRNEAGLILPDGAMVIFNWYDSTCSDTSYSCGYIYFDVNGFKKPNVVGKDIFQVDLHKDRLIPVGASNGRNLGEHCDTAHSGLSCSAKYLYNN